MNYLDQIFNLTGKVAVLTGGAGVLAAEMASGFLKAGVKVVLLDINEANLQKRVKSLENSSSKIVGFDVVEVCPPYDNGETSFLAAKFIRNIIEYNSIKSRGLA